ncbi:hydantoinase/oxoprolinase family protein [Acuticoccus kandeliae]|uniref:hydantoinase/oxoprolinase family protein n=1 Tax=Acuticoccus kandeliae TaxID=2073160 RepID=UPI000D3E7C09|nr:hydantoinase/oxoprolinase family protein [Acuticoccus kandeliae]
MGVRVGVDTGGTHTDIAVFDETTGAISTLKVPTTPDDLNIAIRSGIADLYGSIGKTAGDTARFVYGTTLVTNIIIEEDNVPVGFIGTGGFGDLLEIGRASRRPNVYDINWRPARPLVPRDKRRTVTERIAFDGTIVTPLDADEVAAAADALKAQGVTSVAICFLHAYANPVHEEAARDIIAARHPDMNVSISSAIAREFREYERASTTVINAFVKAPIAHHLDKLGAELKADGIPTAPHIMRGNGGVMSFDFAKSLPAAITHSGPMAGIVGGLLVGMSAGEENLITLDMGGTSADVSLIAGGTPTLTNRNSIGRHPLLVPMLDLIAIGAGGGSIASFDPVKGLKIGPRSAGSRPGPACYGQGGTEATVTDANLVAGRLNGGYFLGGRRALDEEKAREAIGRIADASGMSIEETALGIIAIAEAYMVDAIKLVSVQRGLDPRTFALVGFGGAGPLHAVALAAELGIRRVIIPLAPGNVSALGLIAADIRHDLVRSVIATIEEVDPAALVATVDALVAEADTALEAEGVALADRRFLLSADVRYKGQAHDLSVPLTSVDGAIDLAALKDRFHAQHRASFGYADAAKAVQIVNVRVSAIGTVPKVTPMETASGEAAAPVPASTRMVAVGPDQRVEVPVFRIGDLKAGATLQSPIIVEYPGSTLYVPPGWRCETDRFLNIIARQEQAQ